LTFFARLSASSFVLLVSVAAPAQQLAPPPAQHPWKLSEIYGPDAHPAGGAPGGFVWSPDARHLTLLAPGEGLIDFNMATGQQGVLLSDAMLKPAQARPVNEKDSDHRGRYDQPDYLWSNDSKQILVDLDGTIWLYDLAGKTFQQVADSKQGSGDDAKFSPDGRSVSYASGHNLYVVQPGGKPVALTSDGSNALLNGEVDWVYLEEVSARSNYAWSPDSRQIAYLQMNEAEVPLYPLVDWLPLHPAIDEQRYPLAGDPNPKVRVGIVAATGGATKWITLPAGAEYIPRFGWLKTTGGKQTLWIETLTRNHQHLRLFFADPATGRTRQVLDQFDPKFLGDFSNAWYNVEAYAPGEFLALDWRDGHTHFYRYTYNAADPLAADAKLANQLERGDYEADQVLSIDLKSRIVYYSSTEGSDANDVGGIAGGKQVWAVALDGTGKQRITTTPGTHDASFSPGGSSFVDTYSNITSPPAVDLCKSPGLCATLFKAKAPAEHAQRTPELLRIPAADGKTILYGTLLLPEHPSGTATVPLINNPYGGPGVDTILNRWGGRGFYTDELFAEHGFAVMHLDNRGMGGRGRDFVQASYHDFGGVQLADQLAALDYVLKLHPELDPNRLGWEGWSWGGTFTLNALSHTTRFKAGAAGGTVADFRNYDSIYTERYLGLPKDNPAVYDKAAVALTIPSLHGHLLLQQGTGDDNVHPGNTIQLIQKLVEAKQPYDLQLYPRQTHAIGTPIDHLLVEERILRHFETYLLPKD
jgi:dipeptidyl-peptidase-4